MNSTIVTEHKCVSFSVGVDAADAALKCILPGSENENGANEQHKGREGRKTRARVHNDKQGSHSATTLSAAGFHQQRRTTNSEVSVTQPLGTLRSAAATSAG